ncbi:MAG: site-specific integrase [Acidothermales bacterium]|nr:site-specific integrase [Acidothermales bacterium]
MAGPRYPEDRSPIRAELPERYVRLAELREDFLLGYGHNTARAYWGDLHDIYRWAVERDTDVLALTDKDVRQYVALLRRRKYSESTTRRRMTACRLSYDAVQRTGARTDNLALSIVIPAREDRRPATLTTPFLPPARSLPLR